MAGRPSDRDTTHADVFISSHVQNATFVDCLRRVLLRVGGAKGGQHHVPLRVVPDQPGLQGGNSNAHGGAMEQSEAQSCRIGGHGYMTSSTCGCIHVVKLLVCPFRQHSLLLRVNKVDGGLRMAPLTRRDDRVPIPREKSPIPGSAVCACLSDLLQSPRACRTCERGTGTLTARDGLDAHVERVDVRVVPSPRQARPWSVDSHHPLS
jgi:hypothetical protein